MMKQLIGTRGWLILIFLTILSTGILGIVELNNLFREFERDANGSMPGTGGVLLARPAFYEYEKLLLQYAAGKLTKDKLLSKLPPVFSELDTALETIEAEIDSNNATLVRFILNLKLDLSNNRHTVVNLLKSAEELPVLNADIFEQVESMKNRLKEFSPPSKPFKLQIKRYQVMVLRWSVINSLFIFIGLIITLRFHFYINKHYRKSIERMCNRLENVIEGEMNIRLTRPSEETLTRLSNIINRLLSKVEKLREDDLRRINVERRLSHEIVEQFSYPAVVIETGSEVLLSNSEARKLFTGTKGQTALRNFREAIEQKKDAFNAEGKGEYHICSVESDTYNPDKDVIIILKKKEG